MRRGGIDALINRSRRAPNLKNRVDSETEQAVIKYAIDFPAHGQVRTSNELSVYLSKWRTLNLASQ
ncbi:DNA-binding transcriptional regulator [Vibrio paracholerae HE-16]|nr:DNA-binding transcriptional regulator [Vibrio paracholerae HE-16]